MADPDRKKRQRTRERDESLRFEIRERTRSHLVFDAQDLDALGEALGIHDLEERVRALEADDDDDEPVRG